MELMLFAYQAEQTKSEKEKKNINVQQYNPITKSPVYSVQKEKKKGQTGFCCVFTTHNEFKFENNSNGCYNKNNQEIVNENQKVSNCFSNA